MNSLILFDAVSKGQKEEVKRLVANGADIEVTDENGSTPLIRASAIGALEIIQQLLALRADISHRNYAQQTSLVVALAQSQRLASRLLIASGADEKYALQHLISTGNFLALRLFSEECSKALKAVYTYYNNAEGEDKDKDKAAFDLISAIEEDQKNRGVCTDFNKNYGSFSERKTIFNFLENFSKVKEDQLYFLRYFIKKYPFFASTHIVLSDLLLSYIENVNLDEAIFHIEIANSINQLDLYAHILLDRVYIKKQGYVSAMSINAELKKRFCSRPFERFISNVNGYAYVCCPSWLPYSIGDINTQSLEEIWNSERAIEIRRSIIDGDYSYCSPINCPKIQDGSLPEKKEVKDPLFRQAIDKRKFVFEKGPREYVLGHDLSCNLSCPSCRNNKYVAGVKELQHLDFIKDHIVLPILKHANLLEISGGGEFFVSKHCREILKSICKEKYPQLRLILLTNGLVFTKKTWMEFSNIHEIVEQVHVSVDAFDASIYQKLRKGGNFETLFTNLQFISMLRQQNQIAKLVINMIVQEANYLEMKQFIEMGKTLGCDQIIFSRITNWGTYMPDRFRDIDIASPAHPEHKEFLAMLRDPIFADKTVDLYNIYRFWKVANYMDRNSVAAINRNL